MWQWISYMCRLHRITVVVICVHVVTLLALYLAFLSSQQRPPSVETLQVSLVSLPAPVVGAPAPEPATPAPEPAPEPVPTPPVPTPPVPVPTPPVPEARPDPTPTPVPVPPTPTPVRQPDPVPVKPAWKPNTAQSIAERLKNATTHEVTTPAQPAATPRNAVDTRALEQRLSESVGTAVQVPTHVGGGVTGTYNQLLAAHLYRLWNQPSKSEVQDRSLSATIQLVIRSDGSVTSKALTGGSGNGAMDRSVQNLLNRLGNCPPFPSEMSERFISTPVTLRLR